MPFKCILSTFGMFFMQSITESAEFGRQLWHLYKKRFVVSNFNTVWFLSIQVLVCNMWGFSKFHSIMFISIFQGMKVSCTHFQCAAWSLQTLRDTFSYPSSTDMSHDFLTFQINLMLVRKKYLINDKCYLFELSISTNYIRYLINNLFVYWQAQAQECILEKSMTDNRKSTITAKLAAQIVEYYKKAMKYLDSSQQANIISGRQYKVCYHLTTLYNWILPFQWLSCQWRIQDFP